MEEDAKSTNRKIENKLNELTGKEWIKFTKSWFIHRPKSRGNKKIVHPASFPESLITNFVKFFTKKGEWVLDPFLGTGSTLLACRESRRNGIGIEINKKYVDISRKRITFNPELGSFVNDLEKTQQIIIQGDSRNLKEILEKQGIKKIDFCITSPPYWNQLKRNNIRQKDRKEKDLDTVYSEDNERDIGNIDDYKKFIEEQRIIFKEIYEITKDKGYLVIITNNVFFEGRLYPLAFDTATSLSDLWVLKDEKIWCQDDKALLPLGIYNAWVGNRHHQYCLIFRKEETKNTV